MAITGTTGRSIVETTSSARTIERSLAGVAAVDTLTLTRGVVSIVSNQLSVEIRCMLIVILSFRKSEICICSFKNISSSLPSFCHWLFSEH